jgi:dephospho-CoA kinase
MLANLGAKTYSADVAAREVVEPGEPAYRAIVEAFGAQYVKPDGTLDRGAIANLVFKNSQARTTLEEITHPAIKERIQQWVEAEKVSANSDEVLIVETPLLYEAGMEQWYDRVAVVYAPDDVQVERLMKRESLEEAEARRRVASQLPIEEKRARADWVIENVGNELQLENSVQKMWSEAVTLSRDCSFNTQPE